MRRSTWIELASVSEGIVSQKTQKLKMEKTLRGPGCGHLQLTGEAHYDEGNNFMFCPFEPNMGQVGKYYGHGVAQLMSDGTFEFVPKPLLRAKSILIKKTAHGRLSETKDGAIQLTLKVYKSEGLNIKETILKEAKEALV